MKTVANIRKQTAFDLLIFRRNPAATFFSVILPIIFLVIFTSIFGNETMDNGAKVSTLYVPGILALSIISIATVNTAMTITTRRERGILKRIRATPIQPWVFIASQAIAGFFICLLMTVLIILIGNVLFQVELNKHGILPLLITLAIGAPSFIAMGLALTTIIPSEEAAPAITNATVLPLYFVSDIFIVGAEDMNKVIVWVGDIFPIKHLTHALQESFDPFSTATIWPWQHWLVIVAWGTFAAIVAHRFFRWVPKR